MIKLCDLKRQPLAISAAIEGVFFSGQFVKGPKVEEFETVWAKKCGMKYAIGVSSGADALELAIERVEGLGGEVTIPSWTFKAVHNAVLRCGYTPKYNDKHPQIYAHHLHETKLDYIPLLEDCSHVHGYKPIAETAIFSLFPTKILGACGDAGVIVTNSREDYEWYLDKRSHGEGGTNARMDEVQAAILLVKLGFLDEWISKRKSIVEKYDKAFGRITPGEFHYAYTIPGSVEKKKKLISLGIESAFYYNENYMALPLHPGLSDREIKQVIKAVQKIT